MSKSNHRVEKPEDLYPVLEIAAGIIGEPCWEARLGNGDELILEIGAKVEHTLPRSPSLHKWVRGEWSLRSRGTGWRLYAADGSIIAADEERDSLVSNEAHEQIEDILQVLINKRITDFEIDETRLALTVTFSNQHQLVILSTAEDDTYDLPYWELWTPYSIVLQVGPNRRWSI